VLTAVTPGRQPNDVRPATRGLWWFHRQLPVVIPPPTFHAAGACESTGMGNTSGGDVTQNRETRHIGRDDSVGCRAIAELRVIVQPPASCATLLVTAHERGCPRRPHSRARRKIRMDHRHGEQTRKSRCLSARSCSFPALDAKSRDRTGMIVPGREPCRRGQAPDVHRRVAFGLRAVAQLSIRVHSQHLACPCSTGRTYESRQAPRW